VNKVMKSFFPFLTILLFVGMIGCQEDSGINNGFGLLRLESDAFAVVDFDDVLVNIHDATLDNEMVMNPVFNRGRFSRRQGHPGRRGSHLGQILREIGITDKQRSEVREFVSVHRECIQEPLEAFREANQDIIEAANEQRRAIIESLRNGDISRDEAREQLRELSESIREAIRNDPANEAITQAICACHLTLFDNVRSVLNEEQQSQWDGWVAGLEGPCFGSDE